MSSFGLSLRPQYVGALIAGLQRCGSFGAAQSRSLWVVGQGMLNTPKDTPQLHSEASLKNCASTTSGRHREAFEVLWACAHKAS